MLKPTVRILMLLPCTLAVGPWADGEEVKPPAPATVAAAIDLTTIPVVLYLDADGKCKPLYAEESHIISGGLVAWRIDNQCGKTKSVKLEKFKKGSAEVNPPFNKGCKLAQSPGKDEIEWIICKVKNDLVPNDAYTYSIGGDFDDDPKLVVRPPSVMCEFCREFIRLQCSPPSR